MSIVLGIIKGFIGNWGMIVIDYYLANSLWINGILLIYALLISTCWRNYGSVKKYLINDVSNLLEPKIKSWSRAEISKNLKSSQIPWESAKKQLKIPIIAKSGSYIPRFASVEVMEKLFPKEMFFNLIHDFNKNRR